MLRGLVGPPRIERDVLLRVTPPPAEHRAIREAGRALVQAAGAFAEERGWDAHAVLVGSVPKGTYLRHHVDLDCFVLFAPTVHRDELERRGLEVGQGLLKEARLRYAEHPYVRGLWMGRHADVVPAYRIEDPAARVSSVDRTPFHTDYVGEHLKGRKRQEVRLLKQWLRGIGAYGAETARGGVSGYLSELLAIRFGAFPDVLDAMAGWTPGVAYTLRREPPHPFDSPLTFIDPVDARRNAASAVTAEVLTLVARAARAYRKGPDLRFFFPPPARLAAASTLQARLAEADETLLAVEVPVPRMREDAIVPHLRRAARSLASRLEAEELRVPALRVEGGPDIATGLLVLRVGPRRLPADRRHRGPPEAYVSRVKDFLAKWTGHRDTLVAPYKEGARWWVHVRRAETDPRDIMEARIGEWSLGRHLDEALAGDRPKVLGLDELLVRDEGPSIAEWVLGIDPWMRPVAPELPPEPTREDRAP